MVIVVKTNEGMYVKRARIGFNNIIWEVLEKKHPNNIAGVLYVEQIVLPADLIGKKVKIKIEEV